MSRNQIRIKTTNRSDGSSSQSSGNSFKEKEKKSRQNKQTRATAANSIEQRTSPQIAECIFIVLEIVIFLLTIASVVLFGIAIWVASLEIKEKEASWFFDSELYWNAAIFALTLAAVLLVFAASEKHLAQKERLEDRAPPPAP